MINGTGASDDQATGASASEKISVSSIRCDANIYFLWALCERERCGRLRACCSTGEDCVRKYSGLVPLMARAWILRLFWNREQGLTFEEALDDLKDTNEEKALFAWRGTVAATQRRRKRQ